ncbi:hypothetical protein GCM10017562_31030 [Streptomyces roseofulvus]|uniref:collagen-binding domain-containing protein n=1 Tax=Streptomyces roseofulvus TaxID=33902 RepID=UPI0031F995CC
MKKSYPLLGIAACTVAATLATGVRPAAAATVDVGNPVAGNHGFGVVVETDALLGSTESEGPVAIGGDLSYGAGYNVSLHTPGTFRADGDAQPTALLVGGRIDYGAASPVGVLKVLQNGYVKVGDLTGSEVVTKDANNATVKTQVVAAGQGHGSTPRIELTVEQPALSVGPHPGLMDFTGLFAAYRDRADALASCAATVELQDPGRITLDDGRTNVLRLTGEELNALSELTFLDRPTARSPLVIDVDTRASGSVFTWDVPNMAGVSGADAPYILWNFSDATALTIATGDSVEGTVYAPRAHVTDLDPANIEGDVVAKALTAGPLEATRAADVNAGEIHFFPFAADLSCEGGTSPTPDPSPSTSEPAPEPTDEPTDRPTDEPSPEPSTTEPTDEPTEEPTVEPSVEPSVEPTDGPTTEPAPEPSTTEPGGYGDDELAESGPGLPAYAAAALAVLSAAAGVLLVRRARRR